MHAWSHEHNALRSLQDCHNGACIHSTTIRLEPDLTKYTHPDLTGTLLYLAYAYSGTCRPCETCMCMLNMYICMLSTAGVTHHLFGHEIWAKADAESHTKLRETIHHGSNTIQGWPQENPQNIEKITYLSGST